MFGRTYCQHANPTRKTAPGPLHGEFDQMKKMFITFNLNCLLFIMLTLKIKLPSILPAKDGFIQEQQKTTIWGKQAMAKP